MVRDSFCFSNPIPWFPGLFQQKYILFQPPKGFSDPAGRGSQIHTDMAWPAERPSVLPADTHIPACFQQLFNGHSRLLTVFRAVQENHIRSLNISEVSRRIFSQVLLPKDQENFDCFWMLLERMIMSEKFFELECNRQPEAAILAYQTMRRREIC